MRNYNSAETVSGEGGQGKYGLNRVLKGTTEKDRKTT